MKSATLGLFAVVLLSATAPGHAQSNSIALTWTGNVSQAWNVAGNWSPARVPTSADNVLIPGSTQSLHTPNVTAVSAAGNVTLVSGAQLYLGPTATLNVSGDFINQAGSLIAIGRGTVALVGTTQQRIMGPAPTSFHNLSIGTAGAVTQAAVSIERGLIVKGDLTVGSGQPFTLLSTATGPSYVISAGGKVYGTVSAQRYLDPSLNPGQGYRHLSSPVDNTTFASFVGPGYTPVFNPAYNTAIYAGQSNPYPTVFGYDQQRVTDYPQISGAAFDKGFYSPVIGDRMIPGQGYTVNLPGAANGVSGIGTVITYTGTLNDGDIVVNAMHGSAPGSGWQLLGNPYPSPLDWPTVLASAPGIDPPLYVYKSTGQYSGNYSSYVNGIATDGGSRVLPVGQGFAVFANYTSPVTYRNSQRLSSDSTFLQRTASTPLVGTRLLLSSASGATEAVVYFDANATPDYDRNLDAGAIPAGRVRLATLAPAGTGREMTINSQPELGAQDVRIPLTLTVTTADTYQLSHTEGDLPAGYRVFLVDTEVGAITDLTGTAKATLTLPAGTVAPGRLTLLYSKTATPLAAAPAKELLATAIYPNPASGSVTLVLPVAARSGTAEIINALGQTVARHELAAAATQQLALTGCLPGVYTIRLTTPAGAVSKRLVIQ